MSDPTAMVAPMPFHPWRAIRAMSSVEVVWEAEPGNLGSWCEQERKLRLNPSQGQAERRCSVAHEGIHAERGDTACDPGVHREAARRLIAIEDLADALVGHEERDLDSIAESLWVDRNTLETRLRHLHPSERGYLRRRVASMEQTA